MFVIVIESKQRSRNWTAYRWESGLHFALCFLKVTNYCMELVAKGSSEIAAHSPAAFGKWVESQKPIPGRSERRADGEVPGQRTFVEAGRQIESQIQ